jgi:hypothetical protein
MLPCTMGMLLRFHYALECDSIAEPILHPEGYRAMH